MKSKTNLNPYDHLTNTLCDCKICYNLRQKPNPQISIDEHYQILKSQKSKYISANQSLQNLDNHLNPIQGFEWYLRKLAYKSKTLPNFPILDTIIMQKGQMLFYIFHQNNLPKLHFNSLVSHQQSKSTIGQNIPYPLSITKQKMLDKKIQHDIQYQKCKHKEKNPNFEWAQLDHEAQKMIKQFEKKIKFTDQVLNRVAVIKQRQRSNDSRNNNSKSFQLKQRQSITSLSVMINSTSRQKDQIQEKILSRYQFINLFDKTRTKVCQLTDIGFIQLFPIMYGQEERSSIKQIKYFRNAECKKEVFKEAQNFVIAWVDKNETLSKMEEQFVKSYFYKKQNLRVPKEFPHSNKLRLKHTIEQQYLTYISYKICLHLQMQANLQISQCLLQYITPDDGVTYYLKQIDCIKYQQKPYVQIKQNKLPTYKPIDKEDYIQDLQSSMRQIFENLSDNYHRLNKDWEHYQQKTLTDRKQSDRVFKTGKQLKQQAYSRSLKYQSQLMSALNNPTDSLSQYQTFTLPQFTKTNNQSNMPTLHQILKSSDQSYKQEMLGLTPAKSKHNVSMQSRMSSKFK